MRPERKEVTFCVKTCLIINPAEVRQSATLPGKSVYLQLIFCYFTFQSAVADIFNGQL